MLIGPPASGKSTTAQELAAQLQALVLSCLLYTSDAADE